MDDECCLGQWENPWYLSVLSSQSLSVPCPIKDQMPKHTGGTGPIKASVYTLAVHPRSVDKTLFKDGMESGCLLMIFTSWSLSIIVATPNTAFHASLQTHYAKHGISD